MSLRALLVLLFMLNFGVATWWLLRPGPAAPAPWAQPDGVPRLQLLGEPLDAQARARDGGAPGVADADAGGAASAAQDAPDGQGTAPRTAAVDAAGPDGEPVAAATLPVDTGGTEAAQAPPALRCMSFGPFTGAAPVAAARTVLQPLGAARMQVRDVVAAPRGWSVAMAPQADRAAADALAAKIRQAGFDDLLVVPSGDNANGIALGRYAGEPAARRRETALRAAGFPALAQPLGEASVSHWLDVAAGPGFDAAAARLAAQAPQLRDIDCAPFTTAAAAR
ncbi:SPOR domain-containing protein [Luteimonas sp. MJ246]|uniref:SPOR domain-containing protein n=1 Tax=Luteimonas sp. MJ174 TaxID=3129237 RepID=UPI0031BB8AC3